VVATNKTFISLNLSMSLQQDTSDFQDKIETPPTLEERSRLPLPVTRPKLASTPDQPAYQMFSLSDRLVQSLATQTQGTIEAQSIILAAFKALLYRYTQQETIRLGLILSNTESNQHHIAELSADLDGRVQSRELAEDIYKTLTLVAQESIWESQPSEKAKWLSSHSVIVTLIENVPHSEDKDQQLKEFKQHFCQFTGSPDLHLTILQSAHSISGFFRYNAALFDPDTIERMSGHFQVLLAGMLDDLDCPIAPLPLLTQPEQHQLLVEWNSEPATYPQIPIYRHIEAHAVQHPTAIALRFNSQHLTYAELNRRANQLAHFLTQQGIRANDRVAVCIQPSLDITVCLLGILKAGGVYVPLDPTHPASRLAMILEDTDATVLLTQASLLSGLPKGMQTICLDRDWDSILPFPTHNPDIEILLDQTAYIIYTSGTTGTPKGVAASHHNLVNYILATQDRLGFDRHDVMPAIARFTFSISLFEFLSPLAAGGTLVILEREHILDFERLTQTLEQLTMLHTVPSLMRQLLIYIQDNKLDLTKFHRLKHIFTGGDTVAPDLLETLKNVFQNATVAVLYGCSEVSSLCATYPVPRNHVITKSRVGKPFNNVSLRLYDLDQNLVPIGVAGEIYVGGAGVTSGYLNREDLTQEKFVTIDRQRFYRTGDLGRFDPDGNLEFLGRTDFQIKLRGIRIELGDIEAALRQAPCVSEGVVMAHQLANGEKSLVAYLVLTQKSDSTIENIRQFLQANLPDYMVPAAFVVLDEMPLNPNRKVDRRALPLPTAENVVNLKTFVPPSSEWEKKLIEIWEAILGIHPIGVTDRFIDLGGHSLLATQIVHRIEQTYQRKLPVITFFQAPTIREQATLLQQDSIAVSSIVPIQPKGSRPPLFGIHLMGRGFDFYRPLARHLGEDQPLYGLTSQMLDDEEMPPNDVAALADHYIQNLRTLQPNGPYRLVGISFGGVVAFEMAQRLHAQGQTVSLLGVFDTPAPGVGQNLPLRSRLFAYGSRFLQLKPRQGLARIKRRLLEKSLKKAGGETAYRWIYRMIGRPFPPQLEDMLYAQHNQEASGDYVPKIYPGSIVLFRAQDQPISITAESDPRLGWGELTMEGLEVHDIPGDHLGILKEPNVRVLAETLRQYLN
jgi:amino acid adenylation domain-containing protein